MIAVPAERPVTTPVPAFTMATVVYPGSLQAPRVVASLSVEVEPAQTKVVPLMAPGCGLTVTVTWATQPPII